MSSQKTNSYDPDLAKMAIYKQFLCGRGFDESVSYIQLWLYIWQTRVSD